MARRPFRGRSVRLIAQGHFNPFENLYLFENLGATSHFSCVGVCKAQIEFRAVLMINRKYAVAYRFASRMQLRSTSEIPKNGGGSEASSVLFPLKGALKSDAL